MIARFTSLDPKSEYDRRITTYAYGGNNLIRNIDPDGMMYTDENASANLGSEFAAKSADPDRMGPEWIGGANGGAATYTINQDGTLNWKNASAGTQLIGNALAAKGGLSDLNTARDAKWEVGLNYCDQQLQSA